MQHACLYIAGHVVWWCSVESSDRFAEVMQGNSV